MERRHFLYAGFSTIATVSCHSWVARALTPQPSQKRLIVIFLRGAVDGLSVVVPYGEPAYYQARPKIAIPKPDQTDGVLRLDDRFGLHPVLAPLVPLWQQGSLAFVLASGSPDQTRSHFDAQDYMESGTPGIKSTADGWMNRLLAGLSQHSVIQAVNVGATTPRILSGAASVATLASGRNMKRSLPLDRPQVSGAFDRLYSNSDAIAQVYRDGKLARQALLNDFEQEMAMANNGAPLPYGFKADAQRLARLMVKDARVQLAFLALGGWDTHVNQGNSKGLLARNLQSLGQGLATLQTELGNVYKDTMIVVMSEFGRTVHENGNGGTDHGHGNVMWLMGGPVKGGQVYGTFPGLQPEQLHQGRDLAITTDFREVLVPILERHLSVARSQITTIFPGYKAQQSLNFIV